MNKVEELFAEKGIWGSGSYVYNKEVTIDFIIQCRKFNIRILGIDALLFGEGFTQPSMDNSIDFTASQYEGNNLENVWDIALNFMEKNDDKYYFEIVCE
jgi:hypothetical protein